MVGDDYMVKLKLNGHPDVMDDDNKIKLSNNVDNRLSWTEDGKLTDIGGISSHAGKHPGNGIAGTGGVYDGKPMKGDVNLDGSIDETDADMVLKAATRIGTGKESLLNSNQEYAADFDGDGIINSSDAVGILQFVGDNGPMSANKLTRKIQCDTSVSRIRRINNDPNVFTEDGFYIPNLVKGILSLPNLSTDRNSIVVTEYDVDIIERVEDKNEPGHYIERLVTRDTIAEQLLPLKNTVNPITGLPMSDKDFNDLVELTYQQLRTSESVVLKSDDYDYTKWSDPSYIRIPTREEYSEGPQGETDYQTAYQNAVANIEEQINQIKIPFGQVRKIADSESVVPIGLSSGSYSFDDHAGVEKGLITIGSNAGGTFYPTTSNSSDGSLAYQANNANYGAGAGTDGTYTSQYSNGPLISVINAVVLAYEAAGICGQDGCYSQTNYVDITVNGVTFSARPDCSGLIQAVLTVMGYSSSGLNSTGLCNSTGIKYKDGTMSDDFEYIRNPATYQIQAGDFLARYGHAEIGGCIVDGKLYGWNFGWDGGIKKTIAAAHNMVGTNLSETDLQNAFVNANATLGNGSYEVIIRYKGSGNTTPIAGSGSATGSSNYPNISDEDYVLLCNCVAHEAGSNSISTTDKAYVVEVIMNRVASPDFPNTIRGVITQRGQFEGSSSYANLTTFSSKVTSMVKEAVNLYFSDTGSFNQGYLYFYGDGSQNHFSVEWHGK